MKARSLDKIASYGGIVFGGILLIVLLVSASPYTGVAITLIIASVLYLLISRNNNPRSLALARIAIPGLVTNFLFFASLAYCALVALNSTNGGRPTSFFLVITIAIATIVVEIHNPKETNQHIYFTLFKILLLALVLRWSLLWSFPDSYLGADPQWNSVFYGRIANGENIGVVLGGYRYTPLHHLLIVALIKVSLSTKTAMMISPGLLEVLSITSIFFLGKKLLNYKVGLLAALFLAINNLHILWGWWLVAMTLGISLFPLFLLAVVKTREGSTGWAVGTIAIFIALLFTHTASVFIALVTGGLMFLGYTLYNAYYKKAYQRTRLINRRTLATLAICLTLFVFYWWSSTSLAHFFYYQVKNEVKYAPPDTIVAATERELLESPNLESPSPVDTTAVFTDNSAVSRELNRIGNYIFYGLAVIGVLALLAKQRINRHRFSLAVTSVLTALIVLFFFLFYELAAIAIGRWFVFLDIVLSVPASVGLISLSNLTGTTRKKGLITIGVLVVVSVLMINNYSASFDSPLVKSRINAQAEWWIPEKFLDNLDK